ncbi:unnamed protein product [Albugo candida]|uniref:Uncharacterized protein n=1 Tax=Albugo candida TaxID=65357 RepID=A0A024GC78_9STRA|nr:unnamed protein product [Albugo candida]|eukprot:CCI44155.1 unnamed protein product [Albugo candida]
MNSVFSLSIFRAISKRVNITENGLLMVRLLTLAPVKLCTRSHNRAGIEAHMRKSYMPHISPIEMERTLTLSPYLLGVKGIEALHFHHLCSFISLVISVLFQLITKNQYPVIDKHRCSQMLSDCIYLNEVTKRKSLIFLPMSRRVRQLRTRLPECIPALVNFV